MDFSPLNLDALRRIGEAAFSTDGNADGAGFVPGEPRARIGDYEILEEIGRGGMGVVYTAQQAGLDRTVALKVISTGANANIEAESRFRREAQLAARLRHPNIVTVYESGRDAGCAFFSMDYVPGGDLAQAMRREAFAPRAAAELVRKVADGVAHAHAAGVLHRDLKPSNILLDAGEPRIADFGLSTVLEPGGDLTAVTSVLGTPHYLAPEAFQQGSAAMSEASDVYALGAILYELMTGRRLFAGASPAELAHLVATSEPPAPRLLNPLVARDLETICLKCLAKLPGHRYASAQALADDLARFLADEPILARAPSAPERFARWCRRRPAIAAAWFLLLALALVSAVSTVFIARERGAATEQLRAALLAQAKATMLSGALGQRFDTLDALARAARIRPGIDLRDEALRALALPDARRGPTLEVRHASNSPAAFDSKLEHCVVESDTGVLTLRRVKDAAVVRRFDAPPGNPRAIYVAPLSADDSKLAVRFSDDRVRVYALDRAAPLCELSARPVCQLHENFAYDFGFTPDGRELAIGLPAGGFSLHDATTGRETGRLECGFVPAVIAFSPDGAQVALAALRGRSVEVWDRASGRKVRSLAVPRTVLHCAWHPTNGQLAIACFDNRIYVHDAAGSGAEAAPVILRGHVAAPALLAWSPDGRWLASSSRDVTLRLWDVTEGSSALVLPGISGEPCLRFGRDGRQLACGSEGKTVGLLAVSLDDIRQEFLRTAPGDFANIRGCLDVSADGRLIATAARSGVRLLDPRTGAQLALLPGKAGPEQSVRFTPGSDAIVYSVEGVGTSRRALRWASATELEIGPAEPVDARPDFFVVDVRGNPPVVALAADNPPMASIVPIAGGGAPVNLTLRGEPSSCSLSVDARFLATADREGGEADAADVYVWEIDGAKLVRRLNLGRNGSARFSPDGTTLWASGGEKSTYLLWPSLQPRFRSQQSGFDSYFARDGSLIALAEDDQVGLVRPTDGAMLGRLPGAQIISAAFSVDGRRFLQYMNYRLHAWDLPAVRRELAALGLDWDAPAFSAEPARASTTLPQVVIRE